jgi:hypothetical protein
MATGQLFVLSSRLAKGREPIMWHTDPTHHAAWFATKDPRKPAEEEPGQRGVGASDARADSVPAQAGGEPGHVRVHLGEGRGDLGVAGAVRKVPAARRRPCGPGA